MSYDIFYNKQFIKLRKTAEVIPVFLAGSNNCFEVGLNGRTGRRSRSWYSMTYYNRKGKVSEKPEVILANLDADLRKIIRRHNGKNSNYDKTSPDEIRKHFGYYSAIVVGSGSCGGTSWEKYRCQFNNGIKHALTLEELDKLGVNPYFEAWTSTPDGKPAGIALKTERDYFSELKKWREWRERNEGKGNFSIIFLPRDTDAVLKRLHAGNIRVSKQKVFKAQEYYYVLTNGEDFLLKYTRRGYRYICRPESAKKFSSEVEAEKFRKRLIERERYKADTWKVQRVEGRCSLPVRS